VNKNIVFFDSDCNLCNNAVRFIISNDRRERFCFVPLGSEKAEEYLRRYNILNAEKGTMMLIMNGRIYFKSEAVLRITRLLDGLWPALYIFLIVPGFIRDPAYELVAKYRYRWFGNYSGPPGFRPC
jgi:predicted DCC family thiol-disulfide oxidoreductase YuxK